MVKLKIVFLEKKELFQIIIIIIVKVVNYKAINIINKRLKRKLNHQIREEITIRIKLEIIFKTNFKIDLAEANLKIIAQKRKIILETKNQLEIIKRIVIIIIIKIKMNQII